MLIVDALDNLFCFHDDNVDADKNFVSVITEIIIFIKPKVMDYHVIKTPLKCKINGNKKNKPNPISRKRRTFLNKKSSQKNYQFGNQKKDIQCKN